MLDFTLMAPLLVLTLSWEEFLAYLGVALLAAVKFFLGVLAGLAKDYNLIELMLTSALGAIAGSWIFTYFGTEIRKWLERNFSWIRKKERSFAQRRRIVKIWRRYGLTGVAALIPILSPQISIGIAIAFRERPRRIGLFITLAVIAWTLLFFFLKETVLEMFG